MPVFRRDGIIPSENIPLDAQQPRFAGRRLVRMGMIVPMIMLMRMRVGGAVRMRVDVLMLLWMVVHMVMRIAVAVIAVGIRMVMMKILDPLLALAAAAGAAHQTTSISLRRISSPP